MSAPSEAAAALPAVETPAVPEPAAPEIDAAAEAPIEVDDAFDDGDSAIGSIVGSATDSIGSSILAYRKENGRTYHAYKEGSEFKLDERKCFTVFCEYLAPNDDAENDRLDLQHHLFALTFDGKLFTAPIPKEQRLHRVLDVGTGTGIWAIDFADEHPESEVLGLDLSPIQPTFTPPNLLFQVDDVEEEWTFTKKFDFIYSRMMIGSLSNWPKYLSQAFENLQPGGWMEVVDIDFPYRCNDGTLLPDSAILKWNKAIVDGLKIINRPMIISTVKDSMIAAGFENVTETLYRWPLSQWPKDKKLKGLGAWNNANVSGGLDGLSLALFTRVLGWSREELEVFLVDVRKELNSTKIHCWAPIHVIYGQKPRSV